MNYVTAGMCWIYRISALSIRKKALFVFVLVMFVFQTYYGLFGKVTYSAINCLFLLCRVFVFVSGHMPGCLSSVKQRVFGENHLLE